ncbi:MAG: hypothetical protein LBR33_07515 [Propionibacteriaceae bacterium]|jgi:hypothetical protein|nr:hypothetical protein [Propionibacteriaceae bacterium]
MVEPRRAALAPPAVRHSWRRGLAALAAAAGLGLSCLAGGTWATFADQELVARTHQAATFNLQLLDPATGLWTDTSAAAPLELAPTGTWSDVSATFALRVAPGSAAGDIRLALAAAPESSDALVAALSFEVELDGQTLSSQPLSFADLSGANSLPLAAAAAAGTEFQVTVTAAVPGDRTLADQSAGLQVLVYGSATV